MKYLAALTLILAVTTAQTVKADDEMTKAVEMVSMTVVYNVDCKPPEKIAAQMRSVAKLYMAAAGVEIDNRQFMARLRIKMAEHSHEARTTINFCKMMAKAWKEGQDSAQ